MLRDAALVAGKDLRIEARSRVALNQVGPFAVAVLLLFGLALGPDRRALEPAAAGLFWVAVLLSTLLAVQRSYAIESNCCKVFKNNYLTLKYSKIRSCAHFLIRG